MNLTIANRTDSTGTSTMTLPRQPSWEDLGNASSVDRILRLANLLGICPEPDVADQDIFRRIATWHQELKSHQRFVEALGQDRRIPSVLAIINTLPEDLRGHVLQMYISEKNRKLTI